MTNNLPTKHPKQKHPKHPKQKHPNKITENKNTFSPAAQVPPQPIDVVFADGAVVHTDRRGGTRDRPLWPEGKRLLAVVEMEILPIVHSVDTQHSNL